ncbi:hypothetical protein [Massilia sp. METH4]|uniref:hypothetical protein n=1 Tax=Massilia sp. METH4 TaxID=3123041 RepID=UPI0030D48F62
MRHQRVGQQNCAAQSRRLLKKRISKPRCLITLTALSAFKGLVATLGILHMPSVFGIDGNSGGHGNGDDSPSLERFYAVASIDTEGQSPAIGRFTAVCAWLSIPCTDVGLGFSESPLKSNALTSSSTERVELHSRQYRKAHTAMRLTRLVFDVSGI